MHINELLREKEAIVAEGTANARLLNTFKLASEIAERKIKELEIQKSIAVEERTTQKSYYQRRIKKICTDYTEYIKE